jgi:hypothetical protein
MKIKVTIKQDGTLDLITQDGDFDTGKATLEALLQALQAQGVEAQQTAPVETHNHAVVMTKTSEFSANIAVNAYPSEDGTGHTH